MLIYNIIRALCMLLQLLNLAIFVYCLLTWIAPRSRATWFLGSFIEPAVAPFRRLSQAIMRRWGSPFDFSCLMAMIAIQIVENLLYRVMWYV